MKLITSKSNGFPLTLPIQKVLTALIIQWPEGGREIQIIPGPWESIRLDEDNLTLRPIGEAAKEVKRKFKSFDESKTVVRSNVGVIRHVINKLAPDEYISSVLAPFNDMRSVFASRMELVGHFEKTLFPKGVIKAPLEERCDQLASFHESSIPLKVITSLPHYYVDTPDPRKSFVCIPVFPDKFYEKLDSKNGQTVRKSSVGRARAVFEVTETLNVPSKEEGRKVRTLLEHEIFQLQTKITVSQETIHSKDRGRLNSLENSLKNVNTFLSKQQQEKFGPNENMMKRSIFLTADENPPLSQEEVLGWLATNRNFHFVSVEVHKETGVLQSFAPIFKPCNKCGSLVPGKFENVLRPLWNTVMASVDDDYVFPWKEYKKMLSEAIQRKSSKLKRFQKSSSKSLFTEAMLTQDLQQLQGELASM